MAAHLAENLCILCCSHFFGEMTAAIAVEGWGDVTATCYPARCGRPPVDEKELAALLPPDCSKAIILGSACLTDLNADSTRGFNTQVIHLTQCFHLFADAHLVADAIERGGYLITPSWLADWRGRLAEMGFSLEQSGDFFREAARELVLLDTGTDTDTDRHLKELSEVVRLPVRRIAVGLSHLRARLAPLIMEWRLEVERREAKERDRRHARELADHLSAMDLLTVLTKSQSEQDAIALIKDMFVMLFAPKTIYYRKVENNIAAPVDQIPSSIQKSFDDVRSNYGWMPDHEGFILCISRGGQLVGQIAAVHLTFPEHRERYLNMALVLTGVCALAIENARNRRKVVEAEKMASLGILVAGVAHEINTPLGISLLASSTLERQTHLVGRRFTDRSMTMSDLEAYFGHARDQTALIKTNLERIAQLIEAFHQVAVNGMPVEQKTFQFSSHIAAVVSSLNGRLPTGIRFDIDCDPGLEIVSAPGDWTSILINLIGNSLMHGFKDREQGRIAITVTADPTRLIVDYRDDGVGLAPDVLARLFDPFFTTDLQHGMGLGMHLVYNLVTHRLKGTIQCESNPGQGVHFLVEVPR